MACFFKMAPLDSSCEMLINSAQPLLDWIFPALQSADKASDLQFAGIMSSVLARVEDLSQANPIAVRPEVLSLLVNITNVHWLTTVLVHSYCHYDSAQDQRVWTPNEMQQLINQIDTNTLAIDALFSIIKPLLEKEELYDVLSEFSLARFSTEASQVPVDWLVWLMAELNKPEPTHSEMTHTNSFASKFESLVSSELFFTIKPMVFHPKSITVYLRHITNSQLILWFVRSLIISWNPQNHWTVEIFYKSLNYINLMYVDTSKLLNVLRCLEEVPELVNCYYKFVCLNVANSLQQDHINTSDRLQRLSTAFQTLSNGEVPSIFFVDGLECTFDYQRLLGESCYSKVYEGHLLEHSYVAVKLISVSDAGHQELAQMVNNLISIPNYSFMGADYSSTVIGFSRIGQTSAIVSIRNFGVLKGISSVQGSLFSLAFQLKTLHSRDIVHGRIKPRNLSPCTNGHPMLFLLDVGISTIISKHKKIRLDLDTARYCAPEVIQNPSLCSKAADIYSFAVLAYELITGKRAFGGIKSLRKMLEAKSRDNGIHLGQNLGAFPGNIPFSRFISPNPSERPTIEDVLNCFKVTIKVENCAFYLNEQGPQYFKVLVDDEDVTMTQITPSHFLREYDSQLTSETKLKHIFEVSPYYYLKLSLDSQEIPRNLITTSNRIRLFVATLTSKTKYKLYAEADDTVYSLKEEIHRVLGMHPIEQRIIFSGKQLADEKILQDYNLLHESIVHLILRLRGGKPIILFHPPSDGWKLSLSVTLDPSFWTFTHVYPGKTFNNYTMNWNDLLIDSTGLISGSKDFFLPVSSLFWEAEAFPSVAKSLFDHKWEGSVVVPRIDCAKILHQNLLQVGFTPRDATEMVTYWQPTIEQIFQENIEMVFVDPNVINNLARIDVTIKVPIYRFFIVFRGVDAACTSSIFLRDPYNGGYNRENCIMEWGGMHLLL
ncbi:hypothetical protein RCL1_002435 [Eukaryota sp. TZLM3-RCL]